MEQPVVLWTLNYYDGPISGVARYRGEIVFFDEVNDGGYHKRPPALSCGYADNEEDDEYYDEWDRTHVRVPRIYALYRWDEAVVKAEFVSHVAWMDLVGTHNTYFLPKEQRFSKPDKDWKRWEAWHAAFLADQRPPHQPVQRIAHAPNFTWDAFIGKTLDEMPDVGARLEEARQEAARYYQ